MAVHHDERPTRRQLISSVVDVPRDQNADVTVAEQMAPLLAMLFGGEAPVRFVFWDGSALGPEDGPGTVVLRSVRVLTRLIWSPDELGIARSFIAGDLDLDGHLFELLETLHDAMSGARRLGPRPLASALWASVRLGAIRRPPRPPEEEVHLNGWRHSRRRDAAAIKHHYDVGNEFYRLVIGPAMAYSCARFEQEDVSLEEAQRSKHDLICRKLGLHERPGIRLLDVGCGWGSMAMHAAEKYGAQVVAITLSSSQAEFARERVKEAGLDWLVEVRLQDYRELSGETFDAISSIGMFEHVGAKRMDEYFQTLFSLLAPEGRLLNHAISTPGGSKMRGRTFVNRYVFPDGELIDVAEVVGAMERAGFEVRDVESLREHYVTTLHAWVANLENSWGEAVGFVGEARARIWRLYMAASANGFKDGGSRFIRCSEFVRQHKEQVARQRRAQAGADDAVRGFAGSFERDEQSLAREGAGIVTSLSVEQQIEHVDEMPVIRRAERLIVVVGFDGSESAYRALDASALLISGRVGTVEVVFVAHMSPGAEMSASALTESMKAFDSVELEFADAVRDRLADIESRWRFQRRDGLIAHELTAVADELSRDYGDDAQVVIVVGSAMHSLHHVVGSVPVALVRHAKYPVVVVP